MSPYEGLQFYSRFSQRTVDLSTKTTKFLGNIKKIRLNVILSYARFRLLLLHLNWVAIACDITLLQPTYRDIHKWCLNLGEEGSLKNRHP